MAGNIFQTGKWLSPVVITSSLLSYHVCFPRTKHANTKKLRPSLPPWNPFPQKQKQQEIEVTSMHGVI